MSFAGFKDSEFSGALLLQANLYKSRFFNCNFQKCSVDKFSLASVHVGHIGPSDRMVMNIIDDSEKLRIEFSGIWAIGHAIALVLFLAPYLWFVVQNWTIAQFAAPSDSNITLIRALLMYIYNGGKAAGSGQFNFHWSFVIFVFLSVYNGLRFVLLMKTKKIEHEHIITEKPSRFSLNDDICYRIKWGWLYKGSRYLFFVALSIAAFNFCYFMTRSIPLEILR